MQHYARTSNMQPPASPAMIPFIDGLTSALVDTQGSGHFDAYINYVDPALTPAAAHQQYYGQATYDKLLSIKKVLDPTMVFWNPQAVGT